MEKDDTKKTYMITYNFIDFINHPNVGKDFIHETLSLVVFWGRYFLQLSQCSD